MLKQDCPSAPLLVFAVLPIVPTQFNDLSDTFPVLINLVSVPTVRIFLKFVTLLRLLDIQSTLSKKDTFGTGIKCPSQRGVRLIESQIKGAKKGRDQLQVSVLQRCPSYRESNKGSKERQGPTLSVRFTEVSILQRCPLRESRLYSNIALKIRILSHISFSSFIRYTGQQKVMVLAHPETSKTFLLQCHKGKESPLVLILQYMINVYYTDSVKNVSLLKNFRIFQNDEAASITNHLTCA